MSQTGSLRSRRLNQCRTRSRLLEQHCAAALIPRPNVSTTTRRPNTVANTMGNASNANHFWRYVNFTAHSGASTCVKELRGKTNTIHAYNINLDVESSCACNTEDHFHWIRPRKVKAGKLRNGQYLELLNTRERTIAMICMKSTPIESPARFTLRLFKKYAKPTIDSKPTPNPTKNSHARSGQGGQSCLNLKCRGAQMEQVFPAYPGPHCMSE